VGEPVAVEVGEAVVVVVVGTAVVGEGVVVTGVVNCCASTLFGDSHPARITNTAANAATTKIVNFSKTRVRSVISSPCASLTYVTTIACLCPLCTTYAPLPAAAENLPVAPPPSRVERASERTC
jgi:hypothetical protein